MDAEDWLPIRAASAKEMFFGDDALDDDDDALGPAATAEARSRSGTGGTADYIPYVLVWALVVCLFVCLFT